MAIFVIVSVAIYFSYANVLTTVSSSALHQATLSVIQNEIESIRNMAYEDIGIQGGSPAGRLLAQKIVNVGDTPYTVKTTIRNIDDTFDGTINGTPKDLAPADYKLVEIEVTCNACTPAKMTTTVGPQNLENTTNKGALFINVFDASGHAISGASVHVSNTTITPNIVIDDETNINGALQLVDIATSSIGYSVSVSKSGYTSDQTLPSTTANPHPTKPNATVAKQQVTSLSFSIDHYSTLNIQTTDNLCQPVPNVDFQQTGTRLIGTNPSVYEYSVTQATDNNGQYSKNNLKWDTYSFTNLDTSYEVSGMFNLTPFVIDPSNTYNFRWLMEPKNPLSLLVNVSDASGQQINNAKVTVSKSGFSTFNYTGQSTVKFTDWSGGKYSEKSSRLETDNPVGSLTLTQVAGKYATSSYEWLISSTVDFGNSNTTFFNLEWTPTSQPAQTGTDSLRIQLASNNDNSNWTYLGPDGTANTYYTISNTQINAVNNGKRYMRYKVFLKTQDKFVTPSLTEITFHFRSDCLPNGQAYFSGLTSSTNYKIVVEKSGYTTLTKNNFSITKSWQEYRATITP
jgi:hypothetical protein